MFSKQPVIDPGSSVANIVRQHYHTADIFRKYGIEYCCGGNWPLETVCANKQIEFETLKKELEEACRTVQLPPLVDYKQWDVDFLINYIINIHHQYLKTSMPDTAAIVRDFAEGHKKQYPQMQEVAALFDKLCSDILPHLLYEEQTIFPYIKQIAHAHQHRESYAKLLVKTLRKPLQVIMTHEEDLLSAGITKIRLLTNNYMIPPKACVSHGLALSRLRDLDNDFMQHSFLENDILLQKALHIESELLK